MVTRGKSISWIDEYVLGSYNVFAGNVLDAFRPIDLLHFLPIWYSLWLKRVKHVIGILGIEQSSYSDIRQLLPGPSSLRAILIKTISSYKGTTNPDPKLFRDISNFFARMLIEACPTDPFAKKENLYYQLNDVKQQLTKFQISNPQQNDARLISRLITVAGLLTNATFNDVVTDLGWETYGPYDLGAQQTLLIRLFPNLSPTDLWGQWYLPHIQNLTIYTIYKNMKWTISGVGCHTHYSEGNPINNLSGYSILVNDKPFDGNIAHLITEITQKTMRLSQHIAKMDFESIKRQAMKQECYQLKWLFSAAKVNWKPTNKMVTAIKNEKLLTGIFPTGVLMDSVDRYRDAFGINTYTSKVLQL